MRGKNRIKLFIGLTIALFAIIKYCVSSDKNPYTGKNQHISLTPEEEIAIGLQSAPQMAAVIANVVNMKYGRDDELESNNLGVKPAICIRKSIPALNRFKIRHFVAVFDLTIAVL